MELTDKINSVNLDESSILETYKEKCFKIINDSSHNGLTRIFRRKNWFLRVSWLMCIFCALSLCAFTVFKNISDYLEYKVETAIVEIEESPSLFPSVTICNINPFMTSKFFL